MGTTGTDENGIRMAEQWLPELHNGGVRLTFGFQSRSREQTCNTPDDTNKKTQQNTREIAGSRRPCCRDLIPHRRQHGRVLWDELGRGGLLSDLSFACE